MAMVAPLDGWVRGLAVVFFQFSLSELVADPTLGSIGIEHSSGDRFVIRFPPRRSSHTRVSTSYKTSPFVVAVPVAMAPLFDCFVATHRVHYVHLLAMDLRQIEQGHIFHSFFL